MGEETVETDEFTITKLKYSSMAESWESRRSAATLDILDSPLLQKARERSGLQAITDEAYLLRRKLADRRGRAISLRNAAELVFAHGGPDHANAGVGLFRVVGTERKLGAEHNVEERPRIEGNLPRVIEESFATIGERLHPGSGCS